MFRLLGVLPGPSVDAHLAAAVADIGLDHADRLLEDLVDVHLIDEPTPGRYAFHELLRDHADAIASETVPHEERQAAIDRMLDYYLHVADLAGRQIRSVYRPGVHDLAHPPAYVPLIEDKATALAWCEAERENLVRVMAYAARHGRGAHARRLSYLLRIRAHRGTGAERVPIRPVADRLDQRTERLHRLMPGLTG